jgi:DNA-directed RNA polymerase specialized sigma24 family protein
LTNIEDIKKENNLRLEILYREKNDWLMSCAYNITKNRDIAEELVAELYLYVAERGNPSIWWGNSFNLMYLHSFLKTRFINMVKQINKFDSISDTFDIQDEEYNKEFDIKIQNTYNAIVEDIENLKRTKMWSSAKLAEMYFFSDLTLEGLAEEIGISKSTSFLNVRKIKTHIRKNHQNPFREE